MTRRVLDDQVVHSSETVESRPLAAVVVNVLSVLYTAVVSLIALDTLLEALNAREGNAFVSAIDRLSAPFLTPFNGMFNDQRYWATALIAALVYTVVYLILLAALRRDRDVY